MSGYFLVSVTISIIVGVVVYIRLRADLERKFGEEELSRRVRERVGLVIRQIERVADTHVTTLEDRIATMEKLVARAERINLAATPERAVEKPVRRRKRKAKRPDVELDFGFSAEPASDDGFSDRERAVLDLHQRGESSTQIAKDLSMPRGQVDLILSLYARGDELRLPQGWKD